MDITLGVNVLPVPWNFVSYVSLYVPTSPLASDPSVIVGVAVALIVPSYTFVFVLAVNVIGNLVIVKLVEKTWALHVPPSILTSIR